MDVHELPAPVVVFVHEQRKEQMESQAAANAEING
jgi:hypothetical protein